MVNMSKEEIKKMQISRIEKEIRDTPYHKGTEHHIGRLRARLSKLRELDDKKTQISKGSGGGGYAVKKQGDATVVLVGPPSVGKSTLLNKITNANSKIAPYAFTTLTVIPGMMKYKDAQIQILDVPGIIGGAEKGKGRGQEVLSVARSANLIILITDIANLKQIEKIKDSLYKNGVRLDQQPPNVTIEKKLRGNIVIHSNLKQDVEISTIEEVAREFGYSNAEITIKEKLSMDRLIDSFAKNRAYVPSIVVINKLDLAKGRKNGLIQDHALQISAEKNINLKLLKNRIWKKLDLVRVYLVKADEKPHLNSPIIMKKGSRLSDVLQKLGTDFSEEKQGAKIWGLGAKFPGQKVSLQIETEEGMQIRFI